MVAAVLVHPDQKTVIRLAVEPIVQQDGDNKNDCERNAVGRLLRRVRKDHPRLRCIVIEDGLSSNGPHIKDLIELNFPFILGAKPGDHAYLFDHFAKAESLGLNGRIETAAVGKGLAARTTFNDPLQLNASHRDLEAGLIEHQEFTKDGSVARRFSFVTQLPLGTSGPEKVSHTGSRKALSWADLVFADFSRSARTGSGTTAKVAFSALQVHRFAVAADTSLSAWEVCSRHPGRYPKLRSLTLSYPAFKPPTEHHAFSTG